MAISILIAAAFMLSICSIEYQQSQSIQVSEEHELAHENDTEPISPAMAAFFGGNRSQVEKNSSVVPNWRRPGPGLDPELKQNGDSPRTVFLVVGVVCGALGIGLFITAVMAYVAHIQKSRPQVESGAT